MMQVLHLIDQASREACPTTLAMLQLTVRELPEHAHRVLALGGASMAWACEAAGLAHERLATPYGRALPGAAAVWRRVRGQPVDLVHAWSPAALCLARVLFPRAARVLTLTQPVGDETARSLGRAMSSRRRPLHGVVVLSAARREALLAMGVDAERVHVAAAAVDPAGLAATDRAAVRARWGVGDDARVIALLGDPPAAADALRADLGFGLAYETVAGALGRPPEALLLRHPDQHHRAQSRRMMDNYGVGHIVGQEPRLAAPWQVLPACDAAMVLGDCGGGLSLRWAMAAGLPIVAEKHPVQEEWLESEATGLLCDRDQTKRLAHRLHQVLLDRDLAATVGAAARAAAQRDGSPAAYAAAMRSVYDAVG